METYEELVDKVYNDVSFRSEFKSYLKLQNRLRDQEQNQLLRSGSENNSAEIIHQCKRGISFLYTALFKGLSANYKLDSERVRRVILDVSDKYKQL